MPAQTILRVLFYGGTGVLIACILVGAVEPALPTSLADHIIRNDEGYVLLVMIVGWIEFLRPRLDARPDRLVWLLGAVVLACSVGVVMYLNLVPPVVATLNESFFAMAVLIIWVALPRPVPAWAWLVPVVAVAIPVAYSDDVYKMAELFAALVILPIGLDVVHRSILNPTARTSPTAVVVWCLCLCAAATALHLLRKANPGGTVEQFELFLSRDPEAVIAAIGMHVYFGLQSLVARHEGTPPLPEPTRDRVGPGS